jgi:hypothetical protein
MVKIMPAQRAQIEAAAATIRNINTRDLFLRQVAKVLECCAQPPAPNDVTQALRMCMMTVPSSPVCAKPYHAYQNSGQAARSEPSHISCDTVRAYVGQVGWCRPSWLGPPG